MRGTKRKLLITFLAGIMLSFLFIGRPSEAMSLGAGIRKVPHTKNGYDIYYHSKNILSVRKVERGTEVGNGYYRVEFEIPGTVKKAFITGLTAENVKETQESLIESYTEQSDFSIYSMNYIDAEKTAVKGVDSDLCWAGQAADMLTYAGWTKKAGFKDEDDVYDLFSEVFYDEGGQCQNAFSWFMNGYPGSHAIKSNREGGFLRDYPYDMFYDSENVVFYDGTDGNKPYKFFRKMMKALRNGDAIGINVDWVGDPDVSLAHAITLFGYIYDTSYKDTSLKYYDSFIIADSDSDKGGISDRRQASNSLNIVNAEPYKKEERNSIILDRYGNGVVTGYERLTPYSDKLVHETDPRATRNVIKSPDLRVSSVVTSTSERPYSSDTYLAAGQDVHIRLNINNNSEIRYDAPCTIHASVTDKDGKVLQTVDATGNLSIGGNYVEMIDTDVVFSPLSEGEYTIEGKIEPDSGTKEAYLINNTFTKKITVKNTQIDPEAVSISVSVPDFKNGLISNAKITYSDPSYIIDNGLENAIAISYLEDGKWSPYSEIYSTTDIANDSVGNYSCTLQDMTNYKNGLVKTIDVGKDGTAISVRLSLFTKDAVPVFYYSEPCELKYLSLKAISPTEEVRFDPIPYGANSLSNSQNIEFSFKNTSTYDGGKISGSYYIYAESWEDSSVKIDIADKKDISLGYGETTGPIRINSWKNGIEPAGRYYVYMSFYDSSSKTEESVYLGVISVREKPSTKVTTLEDVTDPTDGAISLREAIAYAESGSTESKKITFEKSARNEIISLDKPIEIEGDIEIEGKYSSHGYAYGHKLYDQQGTIFDVKKGASLSVNGLLFSNNTAKTGGAINADSANITISNCRFLNLVAEDVGGAIFAKNSKVLIKNTTFESCSAPNGGVISVNEGTQCQVLNCIFHGNSASEESLIENKGSTLDIVASSMTENTSYNDNGTLVKSDGKTRILGSVLCNLSFSQVAAGQVSIYGSALVGECDVAKDVVLDELTKRIKNKTDMYYTSYDYVSIRDRSDPKAEPAAYLYVLFGELYTKDVEGVIIEPTDAGLVYGAASGDKLETGIPVLFPKKDYLADMYGDVRGAVYGSDTTPYVEPVVGHSPITIGNKQIKKKNAENRIGRVVCDAAKQATKADIVLVCTSAIGGAIEKGDVTAPMLNQLFGDGYVISRKNINGKDIKKMLEKSIDYMLKDKKKYAKKTLQLGGVTVTYKASAKKGNRITKIMVGSKKIDYKKTYTVAMDSITAYQKPYSGYGEHDYQSEGNYWYDALVRFFNRSSSYIKKSVKKNRYIKK